VPEVVEAAWHDAPPGREVCHRNEIMREAHALALPRQSPGRLGAPRRRHALGQAVEFVALAARLLSAASNDSRSPGSHCFVRVRYSSSVSASPIGGCSSTPHTTPMGAFQARRNKTATAFYLAACWNIAR
jgi:hypothetical protein